MIGTLLQDRYRLDQEIAQGGMGVVYRALDTLLDRPVAVKVLNTARLGEDGRGRLLNEAQAAAKLNHPNIVAIYDAGINDGMAFIVMELVEGKSLHAHQPESLGEILSVTRQVCAALEHAHSHGIIHRDLKPENVLVTRDGTAKLMDFGLARSSASRLTVEGAIVGTVYYLAPEQALGQGIDGRADLYALGVMLYEFATGRLPFTGDDPLAIISQHIHAPVVPPRELRPDLPKALETVILKLLAKDPADRFPSAREVARTLSEAVEEKRQSPMVQFPHNLPIYLSSFIGREQEIEEVKQLISAVRLVTLTGAGGSGKTRLALQVATDLVPDFPDGVWLVELATLSDPELVPQAVATTLGVREQPGRRIVDMVSDFLRSRRLLLVLDNCEHLVEACAQLAETLLRNCPGVKIIATSREAIGITGERAWQVPSLSVPDLQQLTRLAANPNSPPAPGEEPGQSLVDTLARYEAVQLFLDRAIAVQPAFMLTEQNALAVAQICHRLDGIPLAIELAAARMKALSVEQINARLDDRFNLLTLGSRTAIHRHQTLRATIDWSHDLLPDPERILFYRLSVFAGGWTLEAAEAVCSCQGVENHQVIDLLTHLVDKSLALVEEQGKETRYQMLETIRQYAREKLRSSDEWEMIHRRHLEFFLELAGQAEPQLRSAGQIEWLDRLEAEHDNLRAALEWSITHGEPQTASHLAGSLARFWYLHGYWREARDWLERCLQASQGLEQTEALQARSRALAGLAWLSDENGQEAALYEESLALSRQLGDRWGAAFALRGLGVWAYSRDNHPLAEEHLNQSLAIFRDLEEPWGTGLALFNLGWLAFNQDDPARAAGLWDESLSQFEKSGDRWGRAVAIGALGYAARLKNDYGRATTLSKQSLDLFRELGDKAGIANSLSRLGNVAFRRDEFRQTTDLFEESLALNRELGYQLNVAYSLDFLGLVAAYQGDYQRASTLLEESLSIWHETEYRWGMAWCLEILGWLAYFQGEVEQASQHWQESLQIYQEEKDQNGIASVMNGMGLAACQRGDLVGARKLLEEALDQAREKGEKRTIAMVLNSLGRLEFALGDLQAAAGRFQESLGLRRDMGAKRGIAETLEGLARLAAEQGNLSRAAWLLGAAETLRESIGAPLPPIEREELDQVTQTLRAGLGENSFMAAQLEGRALAGEIWEQAVAYALE